MHTFFPFVTESIDFSEFVLDVIVEDKWSRFKRIGLLSLVEVVVIVDVFDVINRRPDIGDDVQGNVISMSA